jgi:hypothetical protein
LMDQWLKDTAEDYQHFTSKNDYRFMHFLGFVLLKREGWHIY